MTKSMDDIERLAADFSEIRDELRRHVVVVETKVRAIRERHANDLRVLAAVVVEKRDALHTAIEASPALFKKPKSRILHGIKLGFAKAKGKVDFADAAKVVARIRKHLPDQAETLIKVTETPAKDALVNLTGADLKRIGVTVTDTQDKAFARPVDTEIDKLIDALLAAIGDAAGDAQPKTKGAKKK